ncbi:MAG: PilZ domain-containing protein [Candidatus Omnitrophica bacterium]|jgi:hypothetical protein|nr:PilZ domain-containing protein [Candidatus Omnitrophota bacterium]
MENRLYERISLPIKLTYEVNARPKIVNETVSKDISGNGICLSLKEKLLPKTILDMYITLSDNNTLKLSGMVIWNRRIDITGDALPATYYDTGIELLNADPININKIITHFYGKSF